MCTPCAPGATPEWFGLDLRHAILGACPEQYDPLNSSCSGPGTHLRLSRLNHRLPRSQAYPAVLQGPAEVQHQLADTLLPQAAPVLHDAAALDTALDVLDAQPTLGERLV